MGVAILAGENGHETLDYSNCVTTPATLPFTERLLLLGQAFESLLKKYSPDLVALERLFFTTNQKTASAVSEVRGMLLYLATKQRIKIVEYTPLEIKSTITGYGKATKSQVTAMVTKLMKLNTPLKYDDEYDAIALGLTALARIRLTA